MFLKALICVPKGFKEVFPSLEVVFLLLEVVIPSLEVIFP